VVVVVVVVVVVGEELVVAPSIHNIRFHVCLFYRPPLISLQRL